MAVRFVAAPGGLSYEHPRVTHHHHSWLGTRIAKGRYIVESGNKRNSSVSTQIYRAAWSGGLCLYSTAIPPSNDDLHAKLNPCAKPAYYYIPPMHTSKAQRMAAIKAVSGSPSKSFSASAALAPRTWGGGGSTDGTAALVYGAGRKRAFPEKADVVYICI